MRERKENAVGRCPHFDKILGLSEPISRRDFLDGVLGTSAGMLVEAACPFPIGAPAAGEISSAWTGYTGEGDYKASAGNTEQVIQSAHAVRDGKYDQTPTNASETGEVYDCVVVGGGFSGLSAGLFFHKQTSSNRNCLILDNAHIFGGVAKRNEFIVDGPRLFTPQACVHFQPPYPNSFLKSVYDAMGLDWDAFKAYQKWQGPSPEISLPPSPYGQGSINGKSASGFFFGAKYGHKPGIWIVDPFGKKLEGTPFSEITRQEIIRLNDEQAVVPPLVYDYPGDAVSRPLDSMTLEDNLVR